MKTRLKKKYKIIKMFSRLSRLKKKLQQLWKWFENVLYGHEKKTYEKRKGVKTV